MRLLSLVLILFCVQVAVGQSPQTTRLKRELAAAKHDTTRTILMSDISASYRLSRFDSSSWYGQQGLALSRRIQFKKGEGRCLANISRILGEQGNTPLALQYSLDALRLNQESGDLYGQVQTLNNIALMFIVLENYNTSRTYLFQVKHIYDENQVEDDFGLIVMLLNTGLTYLRENRLDSAEYYTSVGYGILKKSSNILNNSRGYPASFVVREMGRVKEYRGRRVEALQDYRHAIREGLAENDVRALAITYQFVSDWFMHDKQYDSATVYARKSVLMAQSLPLPFTIFSSSKRLTELYTIRQNKDSIIKYMSLAIAAKDTLFNPQRIRQIETLNFMEQQRLLQIEQAHREFNNKVKVYGLLLSVGILLLGSVVLGRNNRQQRKANALLKNQQAQISRTLSELKATQSQLIQSEKMASLGELTAGIAHEIQNPLNFVNNFSEVNTELIDELQLQLIAGKLEEAVAISKDIKDNEQKIAHHGRRADAIVKGMLQHSRSSSNVKEPTNINTLADEYLRLAYHGLRAKDNSFNATPKTEFDETLGNVNVVPQDMGRVILNLITNAFYTVTEKKKQQTASNAGYDPTVTIQTKKIGGKVEVRVSDNGNGIPQKVLDKIFQPFFTTKPTGQGTGLGLSLSYDIVKAHGGELKVETKEGEGSSFIIELPM